jgi:MFS family permease
MGIFFINCLLYNLVTQTYLLLPLRLLTGACLAMVITSASTYIADVAPPSRRGEAISYFGLANALGFAIGPALGGFVIHAGALDGFDGFFTGRFGWLGGAKTGELHFTSLFLLAAALAVVGFAIAASLPESRPEGVVRRSRPSLDDLFSRSAAFPAAINFTTSFAFAAMVTFMPLFARNVGVNNAGNLFLAYAAALIAMRLTIGRQIDRVSRGTVIVPGIGCIIGALVVMAVATNVPMLFVGAGLYGVGAGAFQPAMMAYLVDQTPLAIRGRAVSTFTLGADLGLSAGSFSLGVVVDLASYRVGFATAAVIGFIGLALFVLGWRRAARRDAGREAEQSIRRRALGATPPAVSLAMPRPPEHVPPVTASRPATVVQPAVAATPSWMTWGPVSVIAGMGVACCYLGWVGLHALLKTAREHPP